MMELGPNQKKWIAALKSGKYQQGQYELQTARGYCCLGVSCCELEDQTEVAMSKGRLFGCSLTNQPKVFNLLGLHSTSGDVDLSNPEEWSKFAKLFHPGGKFHDYLPNIIEYPIPWSLICLNDICGLNFNQIAELLETFPTLFFRESK